MTPFAAFATTRAIAPGTESIAGDMVQVRDREFTDVVESPDPRIAGENLLRLAVDFDPARAIGTLQGQFELAVAAGGSWRGEVSGGFEGGKVRATGLATGQGPLAGAVLSVEFRQVDGHPREAPCATPLAFFEMSGRILQPA